MSRLMKLANKFNCFYLSGKRSRRVALALSRIVSIGASPSCVVGSNARLPLVRTTENIDFVCCVYLSSASFRREVTGGYIGASSTRESPGSRFRRTASYARLLRVDEDGSGTLSISLSRVTDPPWCLGCLFCDFDRYDRYKQHLFLSHGSIFMCDNSVLCDASWWQEGRISFFLLLNFFLLYKIL